MEDPLENCPGTTARDHATSRPRLDGGAAALGPPGASDGGPDGNATAEAVPVAAGASPVRQARTTAEAVTAGLGNGAATPTNAWSAANSGIFLHAPA
eukprot:4641829-Lingulodinium_polyedra.AAC.1